MPAGVYASPTTFNRSMGNAFSSSWVECFFFPCIPGRNFLAARPDRPSLFYVPPQRVSQNGVVTRQPVYDLEAQEGEDQGLKNGLCCQIVSSLIVAPIATVFGFLWGLFCLPVVYARCAVFGPLMGGFCEDKYGRTWSVCIGEHLWFAVLCITTPVSLPIRYCYFTYCSDDSEESYRA